MHVQGRQRLQDLPVVVCHLLFQLEFQASLVSAGQAQGLGPVRNQRAGRRTMTRKHAETPVGMEGKNQAEFRVKGKKSLHPVH